MKEKILQYAKDGNVVILSIDGLLSMPVRDFIAQPADGILYDLNRLEAVTLTLMDDKKWVNDYAVAQTIRALKQRIEELELELANKP